MDDRIKRYSERDYKTGCWNWIASMTTSGYGQLRDRNTGMPTSAHRISYMQNVGGIPYGMFVLHKCNNKRCVNPDHLYVGTKSQNAYDCVRDGGHFQAKKTYCKRGHDLSIALIRKDGGRECRQCHAMRQRERRAKSKAYNTR